MIIESQCQKIGKAAFSTNNFTSIQIKGDPLIIDDAAFYDCQNVTAIQIGNQSQRFMTENGILYSKDKTKLVAYPNGRTETTYVIPSGVTTIPEKMFQNLTKIKTITIPASVIQMGDDVFYGWKNDQTINIKGLSAAPTTWNTKWNENCKATINWNV